MWVEYLNGKQQSFMSQRAYDYFSSQAWLKTVPVTTRTPSQYERIRELFAHFGWKDALICNGAFLLRDGAEDSIWTEESKEISRTDQNAFEDALEFANEQFEKTEVVTVDPFMFYIKSPDVDGTFFALSQRVDVSHLSVLKDSRKVYCIPKSLNKGCAAERYRSRFGYDKYIAAGDSEFDIPMLKTADICLCPKSLRRFRTKGRRIICDGFFPDLVCETLEGIRNGE